MLMPAKMMNLRRMSLTGASAWNPNDKASTAVLSAGNTILSSGSGQRGARGSLSHVPAVYPPVGWYVSFTFNNAATNMWAGIAKAAASLTAGNQPNQIGVQSDVANACWNVYEHTSGSFVCSINRPPAAGDVIKIAWDLNNLVYVGLNGLYYDISGLASGTTPTTRTVDAVTGTFFPWGLVPSSGTPTITINTTPTDTPDGFFNWG